MSAASRHRHGGRANEQGAEPLVPIAVLEVELTRPLESIPLTDPSGRRYVSARVLVRLHTKPLGMVDVVPGYGGFLPASYAAVIWQQLADRINLHLRDDGFPEVVGIGPAGLLGHEAPPCQARRREILARAPRATVLVCTRDRPDVLGRTLSSLGKLEYPDYETIVVDGSSTSESKNLVLFDFPHIRYVRLAGGRLAVGRNRGLAEASGEIVAFTDDDAVVDRHWLAEHVAAFDDHGRVACTTGLSVPLELATPAQLWFEESGAFVEGFERRMIEVAGRGRRSLLPYATGKIGAGVSMAWRTSVLRRLGGFDLAMDRRGGEDVAAFFDALCAGYQIVYHPSALVFHEHRRSHEELRRQIYNHAAALSANLTRCLVTKPDHVYDFAVRVPRGLVYGFHPDSIRNHQKSAEFPADLTRVEWLAMPTGPWEYFKGRLEAKRLAAFARG